MAHSATWTYPYDPSPKQIFAHSVDVDEMLYGGAAGGGKTEFLLAEAITMLLMVPNSKALLLRRTFPELEQEIEPRLLARIPRSIGKYNTTKHTLTFRNGALLRLGYLEKDSDVYRYIGAEYQMIVFDELTTMNMKSYTFLKSRVRAAGEVLATMKKLGLKPCMKATSNPGGRSHGEVKRMFVDPAPPETIITDEETGQTRIFIPAKLGDNPHLDTDYAKRLASLPTHLRRALLDGDWAVLEGVRFAAWRPEMHTIKACSPEEFYGYPRVVAVDYGFAAHFAALWIAKMPDGDLVVYRELYEKNLTAKQQAQLILDSEMPGERTPSRPLGLVMDRAMWNRGEASGTEHLGDPEAPPIGSPAHHYQTVIGQRPTKAMNARITGWALIDEHMVIQEDGRSRLHIMETCRDTIRTVPELPRDKNNPEDVDTKAEDHLADALRYGAYYLAGKKREERGQRHDEETRIAPPLTAGLANMGF